MQESNAVESDYRKGWHGGEQELTITWLFMRDGKRRIPRSVVDPKGGHGKPQKYDQKAQKRTTSDDCIARQNASKKTPSGVSDGRLVEIGANRQSCDPSVSLMLKLMLKLILEVVIGVADCSRRKDRRGPRRNSSPQGSG